MRGARGWVILGLAVVAVSLLAYIFQPSQSSPDHSSNSDAKDGTSAARLFASSMGHPTDQIAGSFTSHGLVDVLFVFTPTSPYTADDAAWTLAWVRSGGVLIYASESGDPELDGALGVRRFGGQAFAGAQVGIPVLGGVHEVAGAGLVTPLDPSYGQVPIIRTAGGLTTAYVQHVGLGMAVVMADPLPLCNGYLDQADNGRLLADLLDMSVANSRVGFDEYHHGLIISDFAPQAWVTTAWGGALLWLLVAIFAGLFLRGRAFGPLIPRPAEVARSDVEWSVAVGNLLRRSSARQVTLGLLANATERAVAVRAGLRVQPREQFWNALWMRSPELAAELADTENKLYDSAATDDGLVKVARRLHRIAHPVGEERRRGTANR